MAKKIKRGKEDWIELSNKEFIEAMKGNSVFMEDGSMHSFFKENYSDKSKVTGNVVVFDKVLVEHVWIVPQKGSNNDIFKHEIIIRSGIFNSLFHISSGVYQRGLQISGGEFYNNFHIYSGVFKEGFKITGGNFHEEFSIYGGNFNRNIFRCGFEIGGGNFQKNFMIYQGEFQKTFQISGGVFQKDFIIHRGAFQKEILITGGEFQNNFCVSGGEFQNIVFSKGEGYINHLLYQLIESSAKIEINNRHINSITFDTLINSDSAIYLHNLSLNELVFSENFKNEGTFTISQLKAINITHTTENNNRETQKNKPSQLLFYKSDMGNAVFIDTQFDSFKKILFNRSKLNNISTSHGHFPLKTKYTDKIFTSLPCQESYSELAETYNHLQLAMEKDGNRTWEQKYNAEYLEWHRLALKEDKNLAQYITLSLNKLSTSYGTSWIRSFVLILILAFVFFFAYVLSLPDIAVGFEFFTWPNIKENISFFSRYYFDFIIPTHKIDFIEGYKAGFWSALIDVFGRIIIGYLIYQTIAAFRQFGKR